MTDCKARQCWCKDIAVSDKDQVREALRIMQDRIGKLEQRAMITNVVLNEEFRERLDKIDQFLLIKDRVNESVQKRLEALESREHPNRNKLEESLARKNSKIKELSEHVQELEKHLGDLNQRHKKTLNELKCAILNDRESRSKLTALQKKGNKSISFKCPACDVVGVEFT